jgi:dynein heavy chain
LDSGVANFVEQLKIISNNAWEEHLIEMDLNKMMEEWNNIKFELIPYQNTGTYIVKLSDEEKKMLDDHVLLIKKLFISKFREVFEEQLPEWEENLKLAQELISALNEYQKYNNCFFFFYFNMESI